MDRRPNPEDILSMQWDRSFTIGIAKVSCAFCHGNGTRFRRNGSEAPCDCVLRAIFRACWKRFRKCALSSGHIGIVRLEFCRGLEGRRSYAMKREEYMADFCLVSRRALDDNEYKIFRYHHLLGADWRLCCRQLKMERGDFFHELYRIEGKLGRVFAELAPYPLYPLREYFNGVVKTDAPGPQSPLGSVLVPKKPASPVRSQVPLALSA